MSLKISPFSSNPAHFSLPPEKEAEICIDLYINKLVDNYATFKARVETTYAALAPGAIKDRLGVIRDQLQVIEPELVMRETSLVLANHSQYTMPGKDGNLGKAACASMAGEALCQSLTEGISDPASMGAALERGVESYQRTLAMVNQRGSTLVGSLEPGHFVAWDAEANSAFKDRLVSAGATLSGVLSWSDPVASYLSLLQELTKISPKEPIGAILHLGGAFFISIAIHYDCEGRPVVFLFDSHGHLALTQNVHAPAFLARSPSLEAAARLLAFLYPPAPDADEDHRTATFYPLRATQLAKPLASLAFPPPIQYAVAYPMRGSSSVDLFMQELEKAEKFLQKEISAASPERSDIHILVIKACERWIFPTLLQASAAQQRILLDHLDRWLYQILPVFILPASEDAPPSQSEIEFTVAVIHAFAAFLRDYKTATKANQQSWIGKYMSPMSDEAMDQAIASQLMPSTMTKQAILEKLVQQLLISEGLEPNERLCSAVARFLEQVIEKTLTSSFPALLMQYLLDDQELTEGLLHKEASSSNHSISPAMLEALLEIVDEVIDLGNPDLAVKLTKFLALRSSVVNVIIYVITHFCPKAKEEPDLAAFVLHLLSKYAAKEQPGNQASPETLSRQLSERMFQMAVDLIPMESAKKALFAFKNYSPLMNLPACAAEVGSQLFLLLQRPESLSAFIYEYLLQRTLIPQLEKKNAERVRINPPAFHPFLEQVGNEVTAFLGRFLKDYVMASLVKDSSLSEATISAVQEAMTAFLPRAIAENLGKGHSPQQQRVICRVLETVSLFLEDFIVARKKVDCMPGGRAAYTIGERSSELHKAMNQARTARGASLIKKGDKQKKLEKLTTLLLDRSSLNEAQKKAVQEILPSVLEALIAQLTPQLLHQLLHCLLTQSQPFENVPKSGLYPRWEKEMLERLHQIIGQIVKNAIRLSGVDHVASALITPILQQVLANAGKQIASLGSLIPSLLFDPSGLLKTIRRLDASLWKRESNGALVPAMGAINNLSAKEKQELKLRVVSLIRKQQSEIPFSSQIGNQINGIVDRFVDALLEIIEDPALFETIIYQYVIEDGLLSFSSSDALNAGGLHYDLDLNRAMTIEEVFASPNSALWLSQLQMWQANHLIPREMNTLQEIIAYLISTKQLNQSDAHFLQSLLAKKEYSLVAAYLDYALNTPNRKEALEKISYQTLIIKFVQRTVGCVLDVNLVNSIRVNLMEEEGLSEEEATVKSIEMALGRRPDDLFLKDMLASLKTSPSPLFFLSRFLSSMKQIVFWQQYIIVMHQTKGVDLQGFYRCFTEATPHLFGSHFTARQRIQICTALQAPLKKASWGEALKVSRDWTGPVDVHICKDSTEGIHQKLDLIRKAKRCVAMSGCYFGGNSLTQALLIIRDKLRTNSDFYAYVVGSEIMLQPENKLLLEELKKEFPNRFNLVITHEVNPFTNPHTEDFFLMVNHAKMLVIDEGTDFLIGGSGLEDRWMLHDGTRNLNPRGKAIVEPLAFRDIDYVFHIGKPSGLGRLIHHQLLELCAQCCYCSDEDLAKRFFDPRFYPINQASSLENGPPPTSVRRVEFFATNPQDAVRNKYEQRIIELIETAKDRIVIDHMYFHPSEALLQALIRASKRGVAISLITNQNKADAPALHQVYVPLSRYYWKRLFREGSSENIFIYEYQVPYTTLHKKIFLIDDCVATGSTNCGFVSMQGMDHEYNVIFHGRDLADKTWDTIDVDIDQSKLISPSEAATMTAADQAAAAAGFPMQYFL
jgi:phosphatidylserine/phosphatidylglycerophosphate/cardiolipin synthase-like enzyme